MKKQLVLMCSLFFLLTVGVAQAKDWKKIRIGVEGAYPPFSSVDASGKLVGFDIDIAMALCEEMKADCKLVAQDWDGIIPALLARKYDAIIASMSITEERKKKVAFSIKYYNTPGKFVSRKSDNFQFSDANLKGKKVGVQRATIHDRYLTDNYKDTVTIMRYGKQDEANLDMMAGRLDLLIADSIALSDGFLNQDGGEKFQFIGPDLSDPRWFGDGAGVAMRKKDKDLKMKFDAAIKAIRANGVYNKIAAKYFDFDIYGS